MKLQQKDRTQLEQSAPAAPTERGLMAAEAMSKALRAEYKRRNMPLLTWKNGHLVAVRL